MSKYSREELRSMAREVLAARATGDTRFGTLVMLLSQRTGLHYGLCVAAIQAFAA